MWLLRIKYRQVTHCVVSLCVAIFSNVTPKLNEGLLHYCIDLVRVANVIKCHTVGVEPEGSD
jgi:hypothetical protein